MLRTALCVLSPTMPPCRTCAVRGSARDNAVLLCSAWEKGLDVVHCAVLTVAANAALLDLERSAGFTLAVDLVSLMGGAALQCPSS